jgi:hypothetical protein
MKLTEQLPIISCDMMKKILIVFSILLVSGALTAQAQRSLPAVESVDQFRSQGDSRSWVFVGRDSAVGTLTSTVAGQQSVDGVDGIIIQQLLALDFRAIGSPVVFQFEGQQVVTNQGDYLGTQMEITVNGITERLMLKRDGSQLVGSATRAGEPYESRADFQPGTFAAGDYMLDLYELYLARHDIQVGLTIDDILFDSRSLMSVAIQGEVEQFTSVPLVEGQTDSVFAIHLSRPQEQYLFFSPDRRLVRADFPLQGIQAIQTTGGVGGGRNPAQGQTSSRVSQNQGAADRGPVRSVDFETLLSYAPRYLVLTIIGLVCLALVVGAGVKRPANYLALLIGGGSYALVTVTQLPLQEYLMQNVFLPGLARGESPYFLALWPSLAGGGLQEILKSAAILVTMRLGKLSVRQAAIIGAFCGAGFGIIEACHTTSILTGVSLFSVNLVERSALIMLHACTGALLGWGISGGAQRWLGVFVATVLVNSAVRYIPIFAQQQVASLGLLYILIATLAVASLIAATIIMRRSDLPEA